MKKNKSAATRDKSRYKYFMVSINIQNSELLEQLENDRVRMGLRYISQVIAARMGDYYDLRNGMAYISAQGVVEHDGNVDELDALIDQNIER